MLTFKIIPEEYQRKEPFPYMFQDQILHELSAKQLQQEILMIPKDAWDRYSNPFEDKWTLRDKYAFPPLSYMKKGKILWYLNLH